MILRTPLPEFFNDICEVVRLFISVSEIRLAEPGQDADLIHTHAERDGQWFEAFDYIGAHREAALAVPDGDALELERANANQYQFTMPRGKVEIEVSFRELPPEPLPFRDVPAGHWAETAIRYVWENGLMAGTGETAFGPDDPLTRGQLVTILWRAAGSPQVDYLMDFSDVSQGSWYGEAIRWACAEGIAGGYGGGRLGPDAPHTREQLAVMLYQYAGWAGHDVSGGAALGNYLDAGDASAWAVEALEWALDAGIVGGVSPTALGPQGQATRAQAAVMLTRLCELDR